jgi:ADP-dependent NAD(P)H-hydrate dehydratase / NAD(P)H-hydrate epimerase
MYLIITQKAPFRNQFLAQARHRRPPHPASRAAINVNGGPVLAAAGSGDVLARIIAGLMAQCLEAVCAAAWMQGEAGQRLGAGLMAEELCGAVHASPV